MTYTANKVQAKVALDVSAKDYRQCLQDGFFINSSGCKPLVLNIMPNTLAQILRELPMLHPLLGVPLLEPPLLKLHSDGLQVGLQ